MSTKNYTWWNNTMGWICFAISLSAYVFTIEPTVSWWDCGEFITSAFKLEVGHAPGAPLFLLLARLATLFSDSQNAALCVNILSALCSAFTILFLFWTITSLLKKLSTNGNLFVILGGGVVGSLAFAFSDSFWFSAVEAEVYAMSSLFTALVFWAILKWDSVADQTLANRWIVLISYLIGLSIGVHLLNLLAIPAVAFVIYFRKYKPTIKGILLTAITSIFVLGFLYRGIIPGIVQIACWFELFFVNRLNLPFYSGLLFYLFLMALLICSIVYYSEKRKKNQLTLITLCFTYIIIGYSSYAMILIRSYANPPLDENNPENVFSLLSYLNREQYGESPLLFGNYYNTPLDKNKPYLDGNPVYEMKNGKYEIVEDKKETLPNYDATQSTLFPRMWSSDKNHIEGYKEWAGIKGNKTPGMAENLKYFFNYQLNFMYWRYFLWNFAGRQNDSQGHGTILNGNWLSGISFIDALHLDEQSELPETIKKNKAYNRFYFLPLLLGLIGLVYQYKKDKTSAFVVFLLFFFTGIAIVLFLNQTPFQPRERDYAYVGSFYAFSIWIGLGVYGIYSLLTKKINSNLSSILAISLTLLLVPALMAKEGYNDHNRSGKYIAHDFAYNILNTCAPNAILFTNGDNDTFPLWYLQEVENIRPDVRIICGALLRGNWYIEQMRKEINQSAPISFSISDEIYRQGYFPVKPITNEKVDIEEVIRFVNSDSSNTKLVTQNGKKLSYIPSKNIGISISNDSLNKKQIEFVLKKNYLLGDDLFILDVLSKNNWKRPIYFATPQTISGLMNVEPYLVQEGLAYRLVPDKNTRSNGLRMDTKTMAENFLTKYSWKSFANEDQYIDTESSRMCNTFRFYFGSLANSLLDEGDKTSAENVLNTCITNFPNNNIAYNYSMLSIAQAYYRLNQTEKANEILSTLTSRYSTELNYYKSLSKENAKSLEEDRKISEAVLQQIESLKRTYKVI